MAPAPFCMPDLPTTANYLAAVTAEIERMEHVAADLRRYLAKGGPGPDALAAAPIVDNWRLLHAGGFGIAAGVIHGHPRIRSGRFGRTSAIVALDHDLRWARSLNRLWRLGMPHHDGTTGSA